MLSRIWLSATPWTVTCQAPLSMGVSQQKYWSELPFPTPKDLPDPGIKPKSPVCPALAGRFFTIAPPGVESQIQSIGWIRIEQLYCFAGKGSSGVPVLVWGLGGGMSYEKFYGQGVELLIRIKVCPGPAFLLPFEDLLKSSGLLICCSWGYWIVTFSWISSIYGGFSF